jgi:CheY-like chemotaxis protein
MVRHESRDPQLARHLGLIQSSGEHLMSVINDVLDYSKLEAGKLPVHRVPFPLHDMLTELVDTYQPACRDKGLQFEAMLEIAADEWVDGDATRLRQILHNLVSNAVKFTARGHVSLRAWRPDAGDAVVFEVRDSGIGIAPQDLPRVFDAFYQAEAASDRRYGGTGLGLTISRDLCRAMGGQLRCDSKMGQGTVFICQLPLPRAMSRQADGGARTAERARRADRGFAFDLSVLVEPHVLLVEDNPVNALVAQAELGRLGVRVTMVDNGPDALGVLERELVDLVLMDCEMPGMDGIETTRRIREAERAQRRPAVTIVALTASGRDVYIERCVPAGMNGYLLKPFKSEELADIVTRHVRTQLCEV